jgi:hypothetical protein
MTKQMEVLGWHLVLSILVSLGITILIWYPSTEYLMTSFSDVYLNSYETDVVYIMSVVMFGLCCVFPLGAVVGVLGANIATRMNFNFGRDESIPSVMHPENTIPRWLIGSVTGGLLVGFLGILVTYILSQMYFYAYYP